MKQKEENINSVLDVPFYILVYKFTLGLAELLLGLGIWLWGDKIFNLYQRIQFEGVFEDPHDMIAYTLQLVIPYILEHQGYIVVILLLLAFVKIFGSIGLYYRKHWGLDLLVGLTFLMLPYELYNLFVNPGTFALASLIINLFIAMYLVNFQPKNYFNSIKHRVSKK